MLFSNAQNIHLFGQGCSRFSEISYVQIFIYIGFSICFPFQENGFNFGTRKFPKNWKILFSSAQDIRYWAEESFKTIF